MIRRESPVPSLQSGLLCCCLVMTLAATAAAEFPSVPLIDLHQPRDEIVQNIREACQTVGFFQITHHGIPSEVMEQAWMASQGFFDLPTDEKLRHKTTNVTEYPYGYEQSEQLSKGKQLDSGGSSVADNCSNDDATDAVDSKETFAIGPHNIQSGMPLRRWASTPAVSTFQSALETYYEHMERLANRLLRILALALDQPEDFFVDKMDHHMSALRLVYYYPLSDQTPTSSKEHIRVRAGAHTDYGALTILSSKTPGLQVLRYDIENRTKTEWYSMPVVHDALVINLGDLMQRWTNDEWVSTLHRVVMSSNIGNEEERRYSMAFFVNINGDTTVEVLTMDNQEAKYPPISAKDHLMAKHLASMGEAKSAEDHDEL